MNLNTLLNDPWLISFIASLASVGFLAIISFTWKHIAEFRSPFSGKYIVITRSINGNYFIIEEAYFKERNGLIKGILKAKAIASLSQNCELEYEKADGSYDITGFIHQRIITVSYASRDISSREVGTYTTLLSESGTFSSGYWSGSGENGIFNKPTYWEKNKKNIDLSSKLTNIKIMTAIKKMSEKYNFPEIEIIKNFVPPQKYRRRCQEPLKPFL